MLIYFRTNDAKADLLFLLTAPEGTTISSTDLAVTLKAPGYPDEMLAAKYLRRVDYRSAPNGDYNVAYQDLNRLDGAKGATLLRPHSWGFKKLDSQFEWNAVAMIEGKKQITLTLPTLMVNGVEFSPEPTRFTLVTGQVVEYSVW